ncbi:helix-turn-helix domain-containing protein [Streptomyces sp. NPDC000594]|uniref:helix-turn-helix domain-containing protein n=1 Tax=Streptomyces sp. NPDC000594 TaxID=3154261 RepID=UPI00332B4863
MDFPDDLSTGQRIRLIRESRGMTREVLAGMCGRGPDWLKKIENGDRHLRSHALILRVAAALQLTDMSVLTGGARDGVTQPVHIGRLHHPAMPPIWDAVMGHRLAAPPAHPMDVPALQTRVDRTWHLWHSTGQNRTAVLRLLPALIRDAEHAVRTSSGETRRAALVAQSDTYRLMGQATAYIAPPELAWVAADRAMAAAQSADEPAAIAAAAWNLGNILRETSYADEAFQVVTDAASLIHPHLETGPDDWRGIYGALQLHAAVTLARDGRAGDAWRHWEAGDQVAKSLPATYVHPSTVFGRANVDFHEVSVAVDLRTARRALSVADALDPDAMPSVERRARLWVEVARGHLQRGDRTAALHVMQIAHRIGAETVAYTPSALSTVTELWRSAPRALRPDAARLAEAIGLQDAG